MFSAQYLLIILIPLFCYLSQSQQGPNTATFRGADCTFHKKWIHSINCTLKATRTKGNLLFLQINLARRIDKANMHVQLFKWDNGYKSFAIDRKVDFCNIWSNSNRNPIQNLIRNILQYNSNINHTCPYESPMIVPGLAPRIEFIPSLLITGNYRIFFNLTPTDLVDTGEEEWGGLIDLHISIKSSLLA